MKSWPGDRQEMPKVTERTVSTSQHLSQPMMLTIAQVAEQLGLSTAKIYRLVASEGLPTVKFGRATRVSREALYLWLKEKEDRQ